MIVGAGIGGLTTALSLHRAGFREITVYERADVLRPLGVGINLLPHAVRELTELGLGDRVERLGAAPARLPTTTGTVSRSGANRADWTPDIAGRSYPCRPRPVPDGTARRGAGTAGARRGAHRAPARRRPRRRRALRDGGGEVSVAGDLIVGADGIHPRCAGNTIPAKGRRSGTG
ncbi:NAD(P)-binding protein [Micromonospora sp. BRA006-A]|nr:NAD(P)-binding protein [Micromonospora sp. BRA006-A]